MVSGQGGDGEGMVREHGGDDGDEAKLQVMPAVKHGGGTGGGVNEERG